MGIQGLLPFLQKSTKPINVGEFRGITAAVDTYCWIHRGAIACAEQLAQNKDPDQYVNYCLKYAEALVSYGIKPVLVFDGQNLPAKYLTEKKRRMSKEVLMQRGKQNLREGKVKEARDCFQQSIDVTPAMAIKVIKAAKARGIDCLVAPYEADAQLAYLNKSGIVQLVISEDSDLIPFGCERVLYKLDLAGNGLLYQRCELVRSVGGDFSMDKFRYMCILAGCDYLGSLPGVGLARAWKGLQRARATNDIVGILRRLPQYITGVRLLSVPSDYIEKFIQANNTFLYQVVFDPIAKKQVPLNETPDDVDVTLMTYAGTYRECQVTALQVAMGNKRYDTLEQVDTWDVTKLHRTLVAKSVWSDSYRARGSDHIIARKLNPEAGGLSPEKSTSPLPSPRRSPRKHASGRAPEPVMLKRPRVEEQRRSGADVADLVCEDSGVSSASSATAEAADCGPTPPRPVNIVVSRFFGRRSFHEEVLYKHAQGPERMSYTETVKKLDIDCEQPSSPAVQKQASSSKAPVSIPFSSPSAKPVGLNSLDRLLENRFAESAAASPLSCQKNLATGKQTNIDETFQAKNGPAALSTVKAVEKSPKALSPPKKSKQAIGKLSKPAGKSLFPWAKFEYQKTSRTSTVNTPYRPPRKALS